MLDFTIEDSAVLAELSRINAQVEDLPLDTIGQLLVDSVHANFDAEGRPDSWEPRKDDNPWPVLNKTGTLYNSIQYRTVPDGVEVYTDTDYGDYQDLGTSVIPPRPFLLAQTEDEDAIEELIYRHLGI